MLLNYYENFTGKGKDIIKNLAKDERMISCNDFFFKTGNLIIKNFDSLKRFDTLYDLLIDLLNEKISILKATKEKNEITSKIRELHDFILLEQESITNKNTQKGIIKKAKTKTHKKGNFLEQKGVIKNALKPYDKRTDIINAFVNGYILFVNLEPDVYLPEDLKLDPKFENLMKKIKKDKD